MNNSEMSYWKYVGHRISKTRKQKKMTQADLAEKLYLEPGTNIISRWENGKDAIPSYRIIDIANVLDVTVDYLKGKTNCPTDSVDEIYDDIDNRITTDLMILGTMEMILPENHFITIESTPRKVQADPQTKEQSSTPEENGMFNVELSIGRNYCLGSVCALSLRENCFHGIFVSEDTPSIVKEGIKSINICIDYESQWKTVYCWSVPEFLSLIETVKHHGQRYLSEMLSTHKITD